MHKKSTLHTKVAVIGAGAVGSAVAYTLAVRNIVAEVNLIDVNEDKEVGEVMDIADGLCFAETGAVKGADFAAAAEADIIIISAGAAQKPHETRLDLVGRNKIILQSIFDKMGKLKPTAIVMLISNPVDILTYFAQEISGLPVNQVFGTGTSLDTARLKAELGHRLLVNTRNIHGFVLGEHGDSEFVAWSSVTVGGVPLKELMSDAKTLQTVEERVRREAYEIISRKGATFFGIAAVATELVEAIVLNQYRIFPLSTRVHNWNGAGNVCLSAPAVLYRGGIERLWPLKLTASEQKKLLKSAETIKEFL